MKKTIIAAGAASLAVAAMPMVGAFAVTGTVVTDTVQVTINSACTIESTSAANTYSDTMTNGQTKSDFGSTSMTIACNDAAGWHLTAVGSSGTAQTSDRTVMVPTGSGTEIVTNARTTGDSAWAMKVTGTGATGFTSFAAVPASATDVATGNGSVSAAVVSTMYQVHIGATQQADTYTGQVTYTLTHPSA